MTSKTVKITCTGAKTAAIEDLTHFQGNLKSLSFKNYQKLKAEIVELGFSEPVSVWENGGKMFILNGHQRTRTLIKMRGEGYVVPPIPVSLIQAGSLKEAKKKVLALTSQYGVMEEDGLYEFMHESGITPVELDIYRFPEIDINNFVDNYFNDKDAAKIDKENQDDVPEVDDQDIYVKEGDIYELGSHRLMCGDSMKPEHLKLLMGESFANVVFADPPYGYSYESNRYKDKNPHGKLQNDDKILNFFPVIDPFLAEDCPLYVCGGHQNIEEWKKILCQKFKYKNLIVWKKNSWSMGDLSGAFACQHELILFGHKGKPKLRGDRSPDVWEFDRDPPKDHPTQKPVDLVEFAIGKVSDVGDIVLDPFGGSGTTLVSCEKSKRRAFMLEIDPKYCQVILSRYQKLTGQSPRKSSPA